MAGGRFNSGRADAITRGFGNKKGQAGGGGGGGEIKKDKRETIPVTSRSTDDSWQWRPHWEEEEEEEEGLVREASRRPFCLCCGRRDASGSRNAAPVPLGWRPASPGSASKASDSAFQLRYRVFPSKDRPFHRVFTGFLPGFYRVY